MVIMRKFNPDGSVQEADIAITDIMVGPATTEQIAGMKWDAIVSLHDDGTGLTQEDKEAKAMTTLGLIFDPSVLTLTQVKAYWKNKLAKDCDAAMFTKYSLIQGFYAGCVATGAAKTTFNTVVTSYATALSTAWAAVAAATTKEQVMAVVFVPPA
jgi:hypothetical protein